MKYFKAFLLANLILLICSCKKDNIEPSGISFSGNLNYRYAIVNGEIKVPYSYEAYIYGMRDHESNWGNASNLFIPLSPGKYQVIAQPLGVKYGVYGFCKVYNISLNTNDRQKIILP